MRHILITGATSGIGRETALLLASDPQNKLILTGRREERLRLLTDEIQSLHSSQCFFGAFDIRNLSECQTFVESIPQEFRPIDVLFNNAGLAKGLSPIHEGSFSHWDQMIDTNLKGVLNMTRLISPEMVAGNSGHILFTGSIAGKEAYANGNVYNATKFAIEGLAKAIRLDLYKYNIRVSTISPGAVETEFSLVRFDGDEVKANIYEDFTPLYAEDIARIAKFIIDQPKHVNIQDIWVMPGQQGSATQINRSGRE